MLSFSALRLALSGVGFPGFLKNPLFWKVAALVLAAFFIWQKTNAAADGRCTAKLHEAHAAIELQAAHLADQQRADDQKRIMELEGIINDVKKRNLELAAQRAAIPLPVACTRCRIPRSRSHGKQPRRLRRAQAGRVAGG